MLKKGDKVVYEGVATTCVSDEFKLLGTGPLVVELEDFEGWTNAKLVKKVEGNLIKIPVIALKNKCKENRYLAASMDVGDWEDPDLDVTIEDIGDAFLIWRNDLTKPTEQDFENVKAESATHKKFMIERFGEHAVITYDVEKWLENYEPVHLEITKEQYENARELASI